MDPDGRRCLRPSAILRSRRNSRDTITEGVLQEAGNRSVEADSRNEENKLLVELIRLRAQQEGVRGRDTRLRTKHHDE